MRAHGDWVTAATFLPDGHRLVSGSQDATVVFWDLDNAPPVRAIGEPLARHSDVVTDLARSDDGRLLTTVGGGEVMLWDLTDRDRPHPVAAPIIGAGSAVDLSRDGRTLATVTPDDDYQNSTCILWDLTEPTQPTKLGEPLEVSGSEVALSPDGTLLAVGMRGGTIVLWDLTDRARPHAIEPQLRGDSGLVTVLEFSDDGSRLVAGGTDLEVVVWNLDDRARPRQIGPPLSTGNIGQFLGAAAITADNRTLATTGLSDDSVLFWDLTDPDRPQRLGLPVAMEDVGDLDFAPDGNTLAVGDFDGSVRLWDITDRAQPRRLGTRLDRASRPLVFSPDGHTLFTGGPDNTAGRWDLTELEHVRRDPVPAACRRTGTALAPDTWAYFAPGVEYVNACAGK